MNGIWEQLLFLTPGWGDLFEILIVGALFYWLLLLVQRTRAMQMLLGLFFVAGTYFVSRLLNLTIVQSLMETIVQYGAIAAIVVFQPELRSALAQLGQSRMIRIFTKLEKSQVVDEILEAVEGLAHSGTGAILVIEQEMGLDEYAESGTPVGATVSAELLATIFTPQSPLHDGAVIIAGDMIRVARAILPLTQFPIDDRSLGTPAPGRARSQRRDGCPGDRRERKRRRGYRWSTEGNSSPEWSWLGSGSSSPEPSRSRERSN